MVEFLKNAPKDAYPMDVLRTGVSMLGLYDLAPVGTQTEEMLLPRAISLTAKVGVIVAYFHRARQGKPNCRRSARTWTRRRTFFT